MKTILLLLSYCLISINFVYAQTAPQISTQDAISDLNYLCEKIEEVHYNPYFKTNKVDFQHQKDSIIQSWNQDSIPLTQFIAEGMKLTALLSGGHTMMDWQNEALFPSLIEQEFIPFTARLNNQDALEITVTKDKQLKSGMLVKGINGISAKALYEETMSYAGGIKAFKNAYAAELFPLLLFFNPKIKAPYQIELSNSKTIELEKGLNVQELQEFLGEGQAEEKYSFSILKNKTAYIAYNQCLDYAAFEKFLEQTFQTIHQKKLTKLIIDIRNNGGGNSELNNLLLNYITKKPYRQFSGRYWKVSKEIQSRVENDSTWFALFGEEFMSKYLNSVDQTVIEDLDSELVNPQTPKYFFEGKTCFLIGPKTFSSANFLADAIKTYQLSTLIGSATGEATNDFGEVFTFQLPKSGNYFFVTCTYDIGADGNANKALDEAVKPDIEKDKDVLKFAIQWLKTNK